MRMEMEAINRLQLDRRVDRVPQHVDAIVIFAFV